MVRSEETRLAYNLPAIAFPRPHTQHVVRFVNPGYGSSVAKTLRRWSRVPRYSWVQQIGDGTPLSLRRQWKRALVRGHSGSSLRASAAYALWRRWWWPHTTFTGIMVKTFFTYTIIQSTQSNQSESAHPEAMVYLFREQVS